jgi:hypothetical protein
MLARRDTPQAATANFAYFASGYRREAVKAVQRGQRRKLSILIEPICSFRRLARE